MIAVIALSWDRMIGSQVVIRRNRSLTLHHLLDPTGKYTHTIIPPPYVLPLSYTESSLYQAEHFREKKKKKLIELKGQMQTIGIRTSGMRNSA